MRLLSLEGCLEWEHCSTKVCAVKCGNRSCFEVNREQKIREVRKLSAGQGEVLVARSQMCAPTRAGEKFRQAPRLSVMQSSRRWDYPRHYRSVGRRPS